MSGRSRELWRSGWVTTFRAAQRYFAYEVTGFEHLRGPSALLVGYHGGPWALDVFMLSARMHDELGQLPRAVFLDTWGRLPVLRDMVAALDGLYGEPDAATVAAMRARGQHLVVLPGGTREALRPWWRRGRIDFGGRRGYLQVALRHRLPIVPIVATGIDATFLGLADGYALSKRLFGHGGIPVWPALGAVGVWPLALPLPRRIHQRIGAPIDAEALVRSGSADGGLDAHGLEHAHREVVATLQRLLESPG